MKKRILFIVNPVSGVYKKDDVEREIRSHINMEIFEIEFIQTEYAKHAIVLARNAVQQGFDAVIAIGGDGSVNEIANGLVHSNVALGLIPFGSGNGFARHFRIPFNTKKCIEIINNFNILRIDTCMFNEKYFVNVAGIGFDAKVAEELVNKKSRGIIPYLLGSIKNYFTAQSHPFTIYVDELRIRKRAYVLAIANAKQYGYGVKIASNASTIDGKLEFIIVNWFPKILGFFILSRLITGNWENSWTVDTYQAENIEIRFEGALPYHIDGEPYTVEKNAVVKVIPKSLNLIIP